MVKQNPFKVKQPELGQKILELRKAKGLTQEELVSKCNINVRTIQRIETGEVTPRTYTVKIILEALGYDLNTIRFQESDEAVAADGTKFLKVAFFVGLVYYTLTFVETFFDFKVWGFGFPDYSFDNDEVSFLSYSFVKCAVFLTFAVFMLGYFRLASILPNALLKTASLILIGLTMLSVSLDIYSYFVEEPHAYFLPVTAVAFGILYIAFGIGLMRYRGILGGLAFFGGVTGIVTGFFLMTLVFAFLGLILVAVFEIFLLVILYKAFEYVPKKDETSMSSESTVAGV